MGGRKESVSVGNASGHHTLSAREREAEEERSILSPINLSSSGWIYFTVVFFHLFTQIVFPSTSLLFKLRSAQCECMSLLWKLERGDDEASKLQTPLLVFRLSKLSLSVFTYCTITVQFMLEIVQ